MSTRAALVQELATALRINNPAWLDALINFESRWNPAAYNKISGATGLIQFMPRTMKDLGLIPADLAARIPKTGTVPEALKAECKTAFLARYPTIESQMRGPVKKYLAQYAPYPSEQSLYMAVFYPAFRNVAPDTAFSASVRAQNPGIDTVQDYVNYVRRRAGGILPSTAGLGIAAVAAMTAAAIVVLKA